jgi:5-oxoprolinase (ATP-hydrolysing) subunit A
MSVLLNIDLGELDDEPEELFHLCTVANVACGGHAGDRVSMLRSIRRARAGGAAIAAHPSYYDREGFGRRRGFSPPREMRDVVFLQCAVLAELAAAEGLRVSLVKAHGGLYHDANADPEIAALLIDAARAALPDLHGVVGMPRSALQPIAASFGLTFQREGFGDRRYDDRMQLVPRGAPDALLVDAQACVTQSLLLARLRQCDTLCLHGDSPHALSIARAVSAALAAEGLLAGAS